MRLTPALLLALAFFTTQGHAQPQPVDQQRFASQKQQTLLPNGTTLAYYEAGDPKGPALVLLHGFTDNARSWSLTLPYLDARYRIIAVDLRGHGRSSAPECCYALNDMAYDIRLLLDRLGIAKASLVGHSLGSILAQTLAEQYPERVDKVVLVSSTGSTTQISQEGSWLATQIAALKAPIDPDSPFMREWYANPLPVDADFIARERAESAAVPLQVWRGVLHALQVTEFGRDLPKLKAPVLILHGSQDSLFDANAQNALRQALPQARFHAFADAGHNLAWEHPQAAAEQINAFLASTAEETARVSPGATSR
ncbi:alpha/beta hydrolase [Pseudomonas putida]|uniref:alpha/beta fold hydrolase n=1 Tax=Pseudomonas putida TaxID=303 RepID=UPI00301B9CCB